MLYLNYLEYCFGRKTHAFPRMGDVPLLTLTLHAFKNLQVLAIESHIS